MNKIILILLLLLCSCNSLRPSWIDENSYATEESEIESAEDPDSVLPDDLGPLGGHFDEEGNWIPDNPEIETTYKLPDISAGFLFDIHSLDVTPALQLEVFEFNTGLRYVGVLKLDVGVGYQRTYGYIGKLWTSVFEISTGVFLGYNWEDKDWSYGVGATIIRF